MWVFHGNFWAKGDTCWGTSYLKAHPLGNRCPELGSPTYTQTVDRIRTRMLEDPSGPKAPESTWLFTLYMAVMAVSLHRQHLHLAPAVSTSSKYCK
ncbi:hypothetical protein E2C01_072084 [Portunus trituberculatus]|uniref:Uncharacterized protein n=1 Tax=Portunus trituberculatus TaxID=210409 RepID=A0A5B7I6U3_PORTR|nr:hypothetical protein [Portunus trituberculatus]